MKSAQTIRVAVVGCGQIADAHFAQIRHIPSAELVACCDLHEDLAWQAATRFQIPLHATNVEQMVVTARPDVVHVTTPAQTHAPLASQLLDLGCHVYVEKPFTLDAGEAERVLTQARRVGRQVCVGHDQLFDPLWIKCRSIIASGRIGQVQHVESILGYPIDGAFGAQVSSNPNHWVRRLPGGLFQNTISHPLYRVTDLLEENQPKLFARWSTRPGWTFPTELQVALQGSEQTGKITFSTYLPPQRITRIYGSRGTLEADFDAQTIGWNLRPRLPGAFARIESPFVRLRHELGNVGRNLLRFVRSDLHYFAGMKALFEQFYQSIQGTAAPPIPDGEIHRVTLLMDRIFAHCRAMEDLQAAGLGEDLSSSGRLSSVRSSDSLNVSREVAACP